MYYDVTPPVTETDLDEQCVLSIVRPSGQTCTTKYTPEYRATTASESAHFSRAAALLQRAMPMVYSAFILMEVTLDRQSEQTRYLLLITAEA